MKRTIRIAAACVAFIAMFMHGLMPVGWMPGGSAGTPITICTMDGPVSVVLDQNGQPTKQKQSPANRHNGDFCPFGASVHLASPVTADMVLAPAATGGVRVADIPHEILQLRSRYTSQSPRAPPSFA
jgi:hypothetical protein